MRISPVEGTLLVLAVLLAWVGYGDLRKRTSFTPGPRPEGVLRVATWNVGGAGNARGHPLRQEHLDAVVRSLTVLDADLVFLQELQGESQLDAIASGWSDRTETLLDSRGRLGVIARNGSLLPLQVVETPARPLVSLVYQPDGGGTLHAVALHASPWSSERRNAEIGAAVDLLESGGQGRAALLCGDLNLDVDPGGRRDLFTDDEHRDVETYNYVAERLVDTCAGRGPTAEPDRRLDYVFVSRDTVEVVAAGVWEGQRVGDMDHHPVVADLRLR